MAFKLLVFASALLSLTLGQLTLVNPPPRNSTASSNVNLSPCGGTIKGDATSFIAGEEIEIQWIEEKCRYGAPFRIAISPSGIEKKEEFNSHIIVDHIPHNVDCFAKQNYTIKIKVPNISCTDCILQVTQMFTNKQSKFCPSTIPEEWNSLYVCADISIENGNETTVEDQSPKEFPDSGLPYGNETAIYVEGNISLESLTYTKRPECYWDCSPDDDDTSDDDECLDDGSEWNIFCNDMIESKERVYCLKWKTYPETIYWVMEAKTKGWAAFGLSENRGMANSDHYTIWYDELTDKVNFIGRYVPGNSRTPISENSQNGLAIATYLLESGEMIEDGPIIKCAFARLYTTGDAHDLPLIPGREMFLLWAMNDQTSNIDVKHTHRIKSGIKIDFFSSENPFDKNEVVSNLMADHGILMFVSWGVLGIAGHVIARYKRDSKNWFAIHVALMSMATFFNLIAFSIIVYAVNEISNPHFGNLHQIVGLIVFIFSLLQPVLGVVSYFLYDPKRSKVPIWPDQIHMWVGRIGLLISVINILIGTIYYKSHKAIIGCYCAYLVFLIVFTIFMEWKTRKEKGHVTRYGEVEEIEQKGDESYKKFEDQEDDNLDSSSRKQKGRMNEESQVI